MDGYPGDLLAGVFPLVFAVDSILPTSVKLSKDANDDYDDDNNDDGNATANSNSNTYSNGNNDNSSISNSTSNSTSNKQQRSPSSSTTRRSLFDRFLDSMASHLVDPEHGNVNGSGNGNGDPSNNKRPSPMRRATDSTFSALLRSADDALADNDSSGDEQDYSAISDYSGSNSRRFLAGLGSPALGIGPRSYHGSNNNNSNNSNSNNNSSNNSSSNNNNNNIINNNNNTSIPHSGGLASAPPTMNAALLSESTAYARHLKWDVFFERARLESISTHHGFPPSKDPSGQSNRTLRLQQARSALAMNPTNANAIRLKRVLDQHPIDGILPSGWLEKHAAALPSVLLVVTSFQSGDFDAQVQQDLHLVETIQQLRNSLAGKRDCSIRLVCLVSTEQNDPTTPAKIDEWISRMKRDCDLDNNTSAPLTMLSVPHDLESAAPGHSNSSSSSSSHNMEWTMTPMQTLHRTVRDASWLYYQSLCRRSKRKLRMLEHDDQPTLLPLAVRYCFKIAIFYEFLLKHEKALKYFSNAYRHLQTYYRHVQDGAVQSLVWNPSTSTSTEIVNPQSDNGDGIEAALTRDPFHDQPVDGEGAGVEVALADNLDDEDHNNTDSARPGPHHSPTPRTAPLATTIPLDIRKIFTEINPPFDMACQCRTVADWLNFKLVHAGLQASAVGGDDHGLLAAAAQWRRHVQLFLGRRDNHESINESDNPAWRYWRYLAQQRHVMSQLVERFPPRTVMTSGLDDVLARCSVWRNYMAAAEAQLRLGVEVRKANIQTMKVPSGADNLRGRFVGGLDSEGLVPLLKEEAKRNHTDIALEMLTRAIGQYESELEEKSKSENTEEEVAEQIEETVHRAGARLYYLAGGVLLGKKQHKEAIVYLERAVKYAEGWKGLELVIRRMLIECYEKNLSSQTTTTDEQSQAIASMILDSYFNSEMSSRNLRRALNHFSSLSGAKVMKWRHEMIDEAESAEASSPFSFAVTFPGSTHATAGDVATASVMIKSNLDYAVHINSVTLLSMAGQIQIPSNALLSAQNANEGHDGGIIIQKKTSIFFSTQIDVPKDLENIASDEGGNGGEKQGTAGKGSFAKSARPRSAGLTSAAGARLISENLLEKGRSSQWSVNFLGGKPLRCDGVCLKFYPVHVEKAAASTGDGGVATVNVIELTIEKKRPRSSTNFKRTPFEEDNYLASAWARPSDLPLIRGPRCLRVLSPMPQMIVTNLTDPLTGGKAIEGTVNRVLIRLQAGAAEICEDIKYTVKCSSMLLSLDGSTTHLNGTNTQGSDDESEAVGKKEGDMGEMRIPSLVHQGTSVSDQLIGYSLPRGWSLLGGGRGTPEAVAPSTTSTLKMGEETYLYFDLYRPHRVLTPVNGVDDNASTRSSDGMVDDDGKLCQTDFDVAITYKQARPKAQQTRGRRRRKPQDTVAVEDKEAPLPDSNQPDVVSLEYTGTVMWTSPLSTDFFAVDAAQKAPPSGSRHPSNSSSSAEEIEEKSKEADDDEAAGLEFSLFDGERVSTRCLLWCNEMPSDIHVEVSRIWFEKNASEEEACAAQSEFHLVGDQMSSSSLFEATNKDMCGRLGKGRKMSVMLTVDAIIKEAYKTSSASTYMGVVCVDWAPKPLAIPAAAIDAVSVKDHGPLSLQDLSTIKFRGPFCYLENAPFATSISIEPSAPRVGAPFEVLYRIMNKTSVHQVLTVALQDTIATNKSVLVAGSIKGELQLSPQATQLLSYTAIATKAGKVLVPSVSISSARYNTWLVKGAEPSELYVLP